MYEKPLTYLQFIVSSRTPHGASVSPNPRFMPAGYDDCISGVTADGKCARSCIHGPGPGGSHSTAETLIPAPPSVRDGIAATRSVPPTYEHRTTCRSTRFADIAGLTTVP